MQSVEKSNQQKSADTSNLGAHFGQTLSGSSEGQPHQHQDEAAEIGAYLQKLFGLTRSLTGEANRQTLEELRALIPLQIKEYPSGTPVYDWVIPDEWRFRKAYIKDAMGRTLIHTDNHNLHVVSYSQPIDAPLSFEELESHLHYLDDLPEAIPYRTSYYKKDWGFCMTKQQFAEIKQAEGPFQVVIDAEFVGPSSAQEGHHPGGSLSIGELLVKGKSAREILVSTYICHPSMANDNLSGVLLAAFLARHLLQGSRPYYSWRFVFVPETIGAIAYCAFNEEVMKKISEGLVISTVGGPGPFSYKQSFDKDHPLNRLVEEVFDEAKEDLITYPFDIHGSDERQYSAQGFRINTVTISKDRYYQYPYYHTSLDNLDFVTGEQIAETLKHYKSLVQKMDARRLLRSKVSHCEVMLSKHDLYPKNGGTLRPELGGRSELDLILWMLFLCDGTRDLEDVAQVMKMCRSQLESTGQRLIDRGILEIVV